MSVLYEAFRDLADARDERDEDARRDAIDERRRRARWNHWCSECRGFSGGPCDFGEPEPERDEGDDEPSGEDQ